MKQFFKNNALLIGGFIVLIVVLIEYIKSLLPDGEKEIKPKSNDEIVDSAIDIIDDSFGAYGTFNRDHVVVFNLFKRLTKEQIKRLHKDFGGRYYSDLTRGYKKVMLFGWKGYSEPKGLNALYQSELDTEQLSELSAVYKSKGLVFPYLG